MWSLWPTIRRSRRGAIGAVAMMCAAAIAPPTLGQVADQGVPVEDVLDLPPATDGQTTITPEGGATDGIAPALPTPPSAVDVPQTAAPGAAAAPQSDVGAIGDTPPLTDLDVAVQTALTELKLKKAERIYDLTFPREQIDWMMRSVAPSLIDALRTEATRRGVEPPPELDTRIRAIVDEELTRLEIEMRPEIVPIYAVEFTDAELDKMLELYASPEGRSMMRKMPTISAAISHSMGTVITRFNLRVGDRIETEVLRQPE